MLALSTAPRRKLAIGLPLMTPGMPVAPRPKLNVPCSFVRLWVFPPMLRYSPPILIVWLPLIQVTRSLRTYVGRVVMLSASRLPLQP